MRIGILTYHNALNVGAVLQAYALQTVLTKMGYNCDIIDYRSAYLEEIYKNKKFSQIKSIKDFIKWIFNARREKSKRLKFEEFNNQYQNLSEMVYTKNNIKDSNERYDTFIVGSDQVWNMNLNGNDTTYLLDFVNENKRKVSYAASFGYKEVPQKYRKITQKGILRLNSISVRETAGKIIVEELTNRHSEVVLDPTLLLDKEDWDSMDYKRLHHRDYILVYIIAATPSILEFAKELGKKHNCDVVCIHNSQLPKLGVKNVRDCSPLEFLSYIKHAKYVVSSSFHGICFSIIFKKEFFFELDEKPNNNNSRIETLIGILDLWKRQIIKGKCFDREQIDYEKVFEKLNFEKKKSYAFLINALKEKI